MGYQGSCHCGAIVFEVDAEQPTEALACNCSYCRRKGFILALVPADAVTIVKGESSLTKYHFNKHIIEHPFCSVCGCQPFGKRLAPGPGGNTMTVVNLRLVASIDLDALNVTTMDGASQ
ncbi:GFA family protein [Sphingomonas sp. UV9]|uniref:GFA family protein n=1 Tax=Sphingomonas sp. UV9 TaxID=1851410 RepID=UPI000FFB5F92|nr:GFA family protein [Sphingomonas sp. UV9]RXD04797.1 GFA family protein [Sphingomonas sp. UV9]